MELGFKYVATLPEGSVVVGMVVHQGVLYVATQETVFVLANGVLKPVQFLIQSDPQKETPPKRGKGGVRATRGDNCDGQA